MTMYIGLDVHSKQTVYVAQNEAGRTIGEGHLPTSWEGLQSLVATLAAPAGTAIGLETGTQAMWVARLLATLGMAPVVLDAREVRVKARRIGQKSDRRDAFEICDGLRRGIYQSQVYVPEGSVLRLRAILSRRRHFVSIGTSEINAAKYVLRAVGLSAEAKKLTTSAAWQKLLSRPALAAWRAHLEMHAQVWAAARAQVERLERELAEAMAPFVRPAERLMTTPGVGPITAATLVAVLGTPARFPDSHAVVSYLGLAPSTYDSGERERHGRITKRGPTHLRALLCEAAHHAGHPRHPLHPYWTRLAAKKGVRKAVVAVAARLARILWRLWRDDCDFTVQALNVVAEQRTYKKQIYYRLRRPNESRRSA